MVPPPGSRFTLLRREAGCLPTGAAHPVPARRQDNMIGCIALTAFLGLLAFKLIRYRHGCAAGYGRWGGGSPRAHHRGWRGRGGRYTVLWHALERLDLTPAQEKVVKTEIEQLKQKARSLRDE